jgi:hypothetical protein
VKHNLTLVQTGLECGLMLEICSINCAYFKLSGQRLPAAQLSRYVSKPRPD